MLEMEPPTRGVELQPLAGAADALSAHNQRYLMLKAKRRQLDSFEALTTDLDDAVKAKLRDDARALARLKQQLIHDNAAFRRDQAAAARAQAALRRAASWEDAGAELARAGVDEEEGLVSAGGKVTSSGNNSNNVAVAALFALLHRGGQRSWAIGHANGGGRGGGGSGSSSRRQSDAMSCSSSRRRSSATAAGGEGEECAAAAMLRDGRGPLEAGAGPLVRTLSARAPLSPAPGAALARVPESDREGSAAPSPLPSPLPSPRAAYKQWHEQGGEGEEMERRAAQPSGGGRPISRRRRQLLQRLHSRPASSAGGSVVGAAMDADGATPAPSGPLALSLAMRRSCELKCQPGDGDEDEQFRRLLAEALAGCAAATRPAALLPPPPPLALPPLGGNNKVQPRSCAATPGAATGPPSSSWSPSLSPRVQAVAAASADDGGGGGAHAAAAAAGPPISTWGSGIVAALPPNGATFHRTLSSQTVSAYDGQLTSPARAAAADRAWSNVASITAAALPVPSLASDSVVGGGGRVGSDCAGYGPPSSMHSDALDEWSARTSPERAAAPVPAAGAEAGMAVPAIGAAVSPQPRRRRLWAPAVVQAALGGATATDALQALPRQQQQQSQRRRHTDLGPAPIAAAARGAGALVRRTTMPGGMPSAAAEPQGQLGRGDFSGGGGGCGSVSGGRQGVAAMTLADVYREASGDPNPLRAGLMLRRPSHSEGGGGGGGSGATARRPALRPLAAAIPALPAAAGSTARTMQRGEGQQQQQQQQPGSVSGAPAGGGQKTNTTTTPRDGESQQPDQPARPSGGNTAPAAAGAWQPARGGGANKYARHWWFGGGGEDDDGGPIDDMDVVAKARVPTTPWHQRQQQRQHEQFNRAAGGGGGAALPVAPHGSIGRADSVASDASYGSSVRHAVLAPPPNALGSPRSRARAPVRW